MPGTLAAPGHDDARPGDRAGVVASTSLDRRGRAARSAGLAVRGVLAATGAELRQLHAVGVVAAVLLGDVVALLALGACERDLGANVGALAGHGKSFCRSCCRSGPTLGRPLQDELCSGGGIRTRDTTIMSRVL